MPVDMTSGSPLRKMLAFSAPMLLGSLLMQLSNLLDGLMIGRVAGVGAFAGIAAAAPVAFLATGFLMGFGNGFLLPIALAVGAGDRDAADRFACAALIMTALLSLLVAVPAAALSGKMIALAGTPADIAEDARIYLGIVLMGMPVPMVFVTLWGILRAEGDTRTPFKFQMLAMGLHLALDAVLIVWLRGGVAGAAAASLIAHSIACALCARSVFRRRPDILRLMRFGVRRAVARRLLSLGAPIALATLISSAGSTAFQFAINSLGSQTVAAVAASDRLLSLVMAPTLMLGGVIEVFSGQNCGANRPDRIRSGIRQLYALMLGFLVPAMLMITAARGGLLPLLVGAAAPALGAQAGPYMLLCSLFAPFQCANSLLKNALQGVGMPGRAVTATVYDMLARLFCALFGVARWGFLAICATNPVGWGLSAAALVVACRAASAQVCAVPRPPTGRAVTTAP